MQIMFTEVSGSPMALEAGVVVAIRRPPGGDGKGLILETHIITSMMGPQGNMAFSAQESVEEIARRINFARAIQPGADFNATLLGFKPG